MGAYTNTNNSGYSQSTAIGYGAQITASNQVVLGTASETVKIPGYLYCPGMIINAIIRKTNSDTTISANSTWITTDVYASITPRFSNSLLLVQANIAYNLVNTTGTQGGILLQIRRDTVEDNVTVGASNVSARVYNYTTATNVQYTNKVTITTSYGAATTTSTTMAVYAQIPTAWASPGAVGSAAGTGRSEVIIYEIAQ